MQSRNRVTGIENKLMVTTEGCEWEIVTEIYTLLCIRQIVNEKLPYNTGDSTQCAVVTYAGWESEKEWTHVCMWLIHFAIQQGTNQHLKQLSSSKLLFNIKVKESVAVFNQL